MTRDVNVSVSPLRPWWPDRLFLEHCLFVIGTFAVGECEIRLEACDFKRFCCWFGLLTCLFLFLVWQYRGMPVVHWIFIKVAFSGKLSAIGLAIRRWYLLCIWFRAWLYLFSFDGAQFALQPRSYLALRCAPVICPADHLPLYCAYNATFSITCDLILVSVSPAHIAFHLDASLVPDILIPNGHLSYSIVSKGQPGASFWQQLLHWILKVSVEFLMDRLSCKDKGCCGWATTAHLRAKRVNKRALYPQSLANSLQTRSRAKRVKCHPIEVLLWV